MSSPPPPPPDGAPGFPSPPGPYPAPGSYPAPGPDPAPGPPPAGYLAAPSPSRYPAGPHPGQHQAAPNAGRYPPSPYPPYGGHPPLDGYPRPVEYPSGVAGQILASERGRQVTDGIGDYFASASDQRQLRRRIVLIALVVAIPVFLIILAAVLLPSLL
jgi:hypothetical protein